MAEEQPRVDAGGNDQLAGLASRVDELGNLFKEWEGARSGAARTRLAVVLLLVVVVIVYALVLVSTVKRIGDEAYQKELLVALSKSGKVLLKRAGPKVVAAGKNLMPVYRDELQKQMKEHRDEVGKMLLAEAKGLSESITKVAEAMVADKLDVMASRQEQKIVQAFPQIKGPEDRKNIMENLNHALRGAVLDVLSPRIEEPRDQLEKLTKLILEFLPEDRREGSRARMDSLFDRLTLDELKGRRFLEEDTDVLEKVGEK